MQPQSPVRPAITLNANLGEGVQAKGNQFPVSCGTGHRFAAASTETLIVTVLTGQRLPNTPDDATNREARRSDSILGILHASVGIPEPD